MLYQESILRIDERKDDSPFRHMLAVGTLVSDLRFRASDAYHYTTDTLIKYHLGTGIFLTVSREILTCPLTIFYFFVSHLSTVHLYKIDLTSK